MSWWGKVIGGTLGLLTGGPIGALLGVTLGHHFDRGLNQIVDEGQNGKTEEQIQLAFFTTTFSVMGYLAKVDGQVTQDEINMARQIMGKMRLNAQQRQVAIKLFNEGKQGHFVLDDTLRQFRQITGRRTTVLQMFVEIQAYGAFADGTLHPNESKTLKHIFQMLGFNSLDYAHITERVQAELHLGQQRFANDTICEQDAYALLGVDNNTSMQDIKKAYRRLMNQHHPDKLVAKGLPEEMIAVATEKTQKIKSAYDYIKQQRGS